MLQPSPGLISQVYILYFSPHILDPPIKNEVKEAETQKLRQQARQMFSC